MIGMCSCFWRNNLCGIKWYARILILYFLPHRSKTKFNEQTKNKAGFKIPVEITVFEDRSYNFRLKQPPASELLKKAAGIEKGSGTPNKTKVAKITKAQLKEIAQKKMEDLNTADIEKAMKIIEGTAKNMGIEIVP